MTPLTAKQYQADELASVREYFRACHLTHDAKTAFHQAMLKDEPWDWIDGKCRSASG